MKGDMTRRSCRKAEIEMFPFRRAAIRGFGSSEFSTVSNIDSNERLPNEAIQRTSYSRR